MLFWIFMISMLMMVPITMLVFGKIFMKRPPKKINAFYGYRSSRSMKNQETWIYAHNYCGLLWTKLGWIVLIGTISPMIIIIGKSNEIIGKVGGLIVIIQLFILTGSIFPVEKALKRNFDKDGRRIDE
ncbi:SdpI family protein [Fusibacter paucivorans]|uniref:SdpI family protein n=1 Tax=Fusibacter paucivorans TaxID=76009 RepID=A0ABS5PUL1_9FIRM|nr:SdpI family protein [Fusibacter paucivorans]MBS7528849.1 SdpI family protein [Fusibacter paucivorans]